MEQQHRDNLEKLGRYLAKLSPKHNKEHFNMRIFFTHGSHSYSNEKLDKAVVIAETHFCGAAACAIGHMPLAMPELVKDWLKEHQHELNSFGSNRQWISMSTDLLGISTYSSDERGDLWNYLFGPIWARCDIGYNRTSWAAADRIAHYLSGKEIPNRYDYVEESRTMFGARGAAMRAGWIAASKHSNNGKAAKRMYEKEYA
jgi:hypothetical protein